MTGANKGMFPEVRALNKIGRSAAQVLGLFAGLLILYPVWLALKGISGPSARRRFSDPFEKSLSYDSEGGSEEPVLSEAVRSTRWTVWLIRALVVALLIGLFPFGLWTPPAVATGATLALSPKTATNGAGTEHVVTAVVRNAGDAQPGALVTFTVGGTGGEIVVSSSTVTDANGIATLTFTSTRTGTSTIRATGTYSSHGQPHSASDTATKTWHHGPPATVTVTPTTDTNAVGDPHTITATAVDVYGNPVAGHTATISVTGAGATETTKTTNASGTVTFTFTSTSTGTSDIRVTVTSDNTHATGSAGSASGSATKVWEPGPPDSVTVDPPTDTNTVGETHTVTATVTDSQGNLLEGELVTFTVGGTDGEIPTSGTDTTDDNGEATFSFTSTKTGTSQITATADGKEGTATKDWVAGPPAAVTITQGEATNTVGDPHTVTATVVDQYGNAVQDGTDVTFTVTGVGATESVRQTVDGVATFTFTSTETGQSTIQAESGDADSNVLNKTWTAGPPDRMTLEPETDTNIVGETHTVTATVFDENNNPVPGVPVTFSVTGTGGEAPTSGTAVTDENGEATFEFTSSEPGTSTVTATVDGIPEATATKVWEAQTSGVPSTVELTPENATNTVGETHTVTALVKDSDGVPVSGSVVTFTVGGTGGEAPTFGTDITDGSGQATFSFTSTKTGESDITATAREQTCILGFEFMGICLIGVQVTAIRDTATKTWVAGPASTIGLSQDSATNTVGDPHTVTATVTDQYGNAVADGTDVTFTVTGVGATEGVRDTSNGAATFTFTSLQSGQSTIQARSGGATSNSLIKTWVAGPPDHMTLEPETDTNIVGETHTVTATIRDVHGNPVRTTGTVVTFTVTGTGAENPKTGTDTTDGNGEATFSFTSTLTGTSTITATASGFPAATATKVWTEEVDEPGPEEPGPQDGSGPDAASWQSNRIDVVVRGTDNAVYHRWWDGTSWHGYESLGGEATSDPSSVSWGPNRLDIFVRGTDNALWHRWYENGTWYGWESLGGVLTSAPDVSSWGPNRLDVFARGTDGQLYHRWWDGSTWQGWEGLGGQLTSGPSAVSWGDNRIDVFVRGTDNALWHAWWDGIAWRGYESLGGVLTSDPDVASWGPNRLDVFVRGTDNQLWHRWYDGANGWFGYAPREGVLTGPPGAVSWGFNRIDVFVRGTDAALWHNFWNGAAWQGYESLGGQLR